MGWWMGVFVGLTSFVMAIIISRFIKETELPLDEEYRGQHVIITGGSSGLGEVLARQLVRVGAIVTIVARGQNQLEKVVHSVQDEMASSPETKDRLGHISYLTCDVTDEQAAAEMVAEAERLSGPIYALFCCAGAAQPGLFLDQTPTHHRRQMELNYLGTVNCLHPVLQKFIKYGGLPPTHRGRRRVVLVSSTLGLMGLVGYSQYVPTKFAIRGLAESLRQELLPWQDNFTIHIYYVATITSAGYAREQENKPPITKAIEEADRSTNTSPEARAQTLLQGIARNRFAIISDHITDILWLAGMGAAPGGAQTLLEKLYEILTIPFAHWGLTIWRRYADGLVLKYHKQKA